jgi:hypothetical protein
MFACDPVPINWASVKLSWDADTDEAGLSTIPLFCEFRNRDNFGEARVVRGEFAVDLRCLSESFGALGVLGVSEL